jgi:hypothetical protein
MTSIPYYKNINYYISSSKIFCLIKLLFLIIYKISRYNITVFQHLLLVYHTKKSIQTFIIDFRRINELFDA